MAEGLAEVEVTQELRAIACAFARGDRAREQAVIDVVLCGRPYRHVSRETGVPVATIADLASKFRKVLAEIIQRGLEVRLVENQDVE